MQFLSLFAVSAFTLFLFGPFVSASPSGIQCGIYDEKKTPGVKWESKGILSIEDGSKGGKLAKMNYIKVHDYMYTIHDGTGRIKGSTLYGNVIRSSGKGTGQQFKMNFLDFNGEAVRSYWILPNQRCTIESPFDAREIVAISIDARK
jgi:hypothetical protein